MADRKLSATITIGGAVNSSLGKAFGAVTKNAKGVGAELKAISQQTKELEKMVKELKAAGKATGDLEKKLAGLYRTQAAMRARQGRLQAIGGMLHSGGGLNLGPTGSLIARGLASSETLGPATVSSLTAIGAAAPFIAATAAAVAAVAVAGVAATAAVFALGKATGDFIDNTADMADSLGVTSSNLLGLQYAAGQSGIDADKLNEKLAKLTLSLESAKDGTGPTADALRQLGLSWQELSVMRPEEQLLAIANAFKTYKGEMPKVSIANALFGKGSARFVNFLNQGGDGIRGMMADARKVGYAINGEQEKLAANFDAQMSKMGASFKGIWLEIGTTVLPVINDGLGQIVGWLNNPETRAGFKAFGDAIVPVMKELGRYLPFLLGVMDKVLWVVTKVMEAFAATAKWSRSVGEGIGGIFFDSGEDTTGVPNARRQQRLPDVPEPVRPVGTVKTLRRATAQVTAEGKGDLLEPAKTAQVGETQKSPVLQPASTDGKTELKETAKPATPPVLAEPRSNGKGFGKPQAASASNTNNYNITVNGATGENVQELAEKVRRHLRDLNPQQVGAY